MNRIGEIPNGPARPPERPGFVPMPGGKPPAGRPGGNYVPLPNAKPRPRPGNEIIARDLIKNMIIHGQWQLHDKLSYPYPYCNYYFCPGYPPKL